MNLIRRTPMRVYDALCRLKWELGQTTAEYALVLLAAAAVAVVLIKWASDNSTLTEFFDAIVDQLKSMAGADGGGA
jgi:Flp pilus assembly pilin Flp